MGEHACVLISCFEERERERPHTGSCLVREILIFQIYFFPIKKKIIIKIFQVKYIFGPLVYV